MLGHSALSAPSRLFTEDQVTAFHVTSWNTPFTPLESGVASGGMVLDAREPVTATTDWPGYLNGLKAASASGVAAAFTDTRSTALVTSGRSPSVFDSWSAGAPAWYGNSQRGKVALHWSGVLRPVTGRSWFSASASVTMSLAVAGSGYLRIIRTPSGGAATEVTIGGTAGRTLTETDYLTTGVTFTSTFTVAAGDRLDIYYVQNKDVWGGLVVKAVLGSTQTELLARSAPVLGCDLFDDGAPPAALALGSIDSVEITHDLNGAATAMINVPLLNANRHDGFGYQWLRLAGGDDPGTLQYWTGGATQFSLRRGQLIQITGGLVGEEYTVFTGVIDDFEPPKSGTTAIRCTGFERRALKDFARNEPDEVSYMLAGYRARTGSTEPIYGIAAYDNWAIEYAIQDVLLRAGINSSRLMAPKTATKADGSSAAISYTKIDGTGATVADPFLKFRARGVLGNLLRCERSVRYGNVGYNFQDYKPADDPYVFKPEDSKDAWSRVREIADRYGYDARFDANGDAVLQTRGNASTAVDVDNTLVTNGINGTKKTHPSAFKGTYYEWTGGANPALSFTFTGSRVDVALPRGVNLGPFAYMKVVRVSDAVEMARASNIATAASSDAFFYDYRTSATGANATLLTLFSGAFDTYRVDVLGLSGASDGLTRRLDAFFVYAVDPLMPLYAAPLSLAANALDINGGTAADDQRNLVYVIGRRKATVTDSEKLKTNPNNAEPEFIVSVAVDTASINDPTSRNYTGARHTAAIFDSSIADPDYADYIARTFIYRYRSPRPPADITHTILPQLELRDPLFATESKFNSVNELYVLFATRYTHRFERTGAATTVIQTSAWPEFASYDLREDIDIDADFAGVPIANVAVSYTSVTGQQQTNRSSHGVVQTSTDADVVSVSVPVTAGSPPYLDLTGQDWPPVPGTVFLLPVTTHGPAAANSTSYPAANLTGTQAVANLAMLNPGGSIGPIKLPTGRTIASVVATGWTMTGPGVAKQSESFTLGTHSTTGGALWYEWDEVKRTVFVYRSRITLGSPPYTFWTVTVTYSDALGGANGDVLTDTPYHHLTNIDYRDTSRKIFLPWKQGDGSSVYQLPSAYTSFTVKYRRLWQNTSGSFVDPYAGNSPFADPTTTELGYLCSLTFDALVTGYYRITVRSVHDDTVVAYLTETTGDVTDPEAHWSYVTAGKSRSWNWDFVDQLGTWNLRQSADYSAAVQGVFELPEKQPIGAGWYVWNRDRDHGALGPLALISGDRDATTGKPVFGLGTYAAWYFQIEVQNDKLLDAHNANAALQYPRVVKTIEPQQGELAVTYSTGSTTAAVVYTHLPEPSLCELTTQDWIAAFAYDPTNAAHATTDANWGAQDTDATINTQKPVRVQFTVKPRPGTLWAGNTAEQQVMLTRHVHLRALIFDQFAVDEGGSYPNSSVPMRTVYSRRMTDDDHTILFADQGFRKAKTFHNATYPTGTLQWVFKPDDFRKKFRDIENEPLSFANYLQLTEVPKYDLNRTVAGSNARFIVGFMAYLFYLSAFVQDRSGRRTWAVNRQFLDKSKIANNAVGDWWDPATPQTAATTTTYRADWPVDPVQQLRRSVVCRQWTNEPGWQTAQRTRWGLTAGSLGDKLLRFKWQDMEPAAVNLNGAAWPVLETDEHSKWHTDGGRTELPGSYVLTRQLGTTGTGQATWLGNWTWEGSPKWIPAISRDFHPYFLLPPMPDPSGAAVDPTRPWQKVTNPNANYLYIMVDGRRYSNVTNEGGDAAAGPTWGSWCRDMTQTYDSSGSGLKRFAVGTHIDTAVDPNKPVLAANAHDYVRQDDMVHFEDLRGLYSRGPRPAEAPKKVTPVTPYFLNLYTYAGLTVGQSLPANTTVHDHDSNIPKWGVAVSSWFRMSFRREYVVETEKFFPVDYLGREYPGGFNADRARIPGQPSLSYDAGAWVGWKDDLTSGTSLGSATGLDGGGVAYTNVFDGTWMPFQLGPVLPETQDIYMHLTLVNERRAVALP